MLLVTMTALNYYEEHRPQASNILGLISHTIGDMRLQHFEKVLFLLHTRRSDQKQDRKYQDLIAIVECLCGYSDLLASRPHCGNILRTLEGDLRMMEKMHNVQRPGDASPTTTCGIAILRAKYRKLMTKLGLPFHFYGDHFSNPESVEHTQGQSIGTQKSDIFAAIGDFIRHLFELERFSGLSNLLLGFPSPSKGSTSQQYHLDADI